MALKSVQKFTPRNRGKLVGQIYKTICLYSDFFPARPRTYIKEILSEDGNVYWLENDRTKDVSSIALIESKYRMELDGTKLAIIGHTISKQGNQMYSLLSHLLGDFTSESLLVLCRKIVGESLQLSNYGFKMFSPAKLKDIWPNLAEHKTDYFNINNEKLWQGLDRKEFVVYLKLAPSDLEKLKETHKDLVEEVVSQTA